MTRPSAITFDVYGTLARWDETVQDAIRHVLSAHDRADADMSLAANAFEAESRRLQTLGAFRSYRGILSDSLTPALATAGLRPNAADVAMVLDRLSRIPLFDDALPILDALSREFRLAPISNTDDDLLAGTLDGLGSVFATIITAEQARAYKPNPGLFRFALQKLGADPSDILHVAQGPFSDLAVCSALGIRVIWINRKRATLQDGLQPLAIIENLARLPEIVASL